MPRGLQSSNPAPQVSSTDGGGEAKPAVLTGRVREDQLRGQQHGDVAGVQGNRRAAFAQPGQADRLSSETLLGGPSGAESQSDHNNKLSAKTIISDPSSAWASAKSPVPAKAALEEGIYKQLDVVDETSSTPAGYRLGIIQFSMIDIYSAIYAHLAGRAQGLQAAVFLSGHPLAQEAFAGRPWLSRC